MTTERDRIQARTAAEAQHVAKATRIDLNAFLALSDAERGARWRQWSLASKQDVVIQQIEALGYDWDAAAVAHFVAKYDTRWENGQQDSDLVVPAASAILARASDDSDTARRHEDYQGVRQLDRVRMNVLRGARLCWVRGDLLIASINHPGVVYSVNRSGCSCPNGAAGRAQCWHVALFDLLLAMLETEAETADMEAGADDDETPAPLPLPTWPSELGDTEGDPTPPDRPRRPLALIVVAARARCWATL